jgi:Spx/MgsR family transcriptional regulator
MILYGIPTCDTCKKAQKALNDEGYEVTFRDIRADPLSETEWTEFLTEFGSALVNQKSTTYRGLSMWLRESEADAQLLAHPTLMKRPVLKVGDKMTLGWDTVAQEIWLKQ